MTIIIKTLKQKINCKENEVTVGCWFFKARVKECYNNNTKEPLPTTIAFSESVLSYGTLATTPFKRRRLLISLTLKVLSIFLGLILNASHK